MLRVPYYKMITPLLFFIAISCEQMLDVDLPNNQINSNEVFTDASTAQAALTGLYSALRDNSPIAGDQVGRLLGVYTDDLDYYATASNNGIAEISKNTHISSNPTIYSYWSNAYKQIYVANSIIERINNASSIPEEERSRIYGEALLIRCILFYYLERTFGEVPLVLSTDYRVNQSLDKSSSSEIQTRLEDDLKTSIALLSDGYRSTERIYVNRKVAELMLGKLYLDQKRWHESEDLLKTIVNNSIYAMEQDISNVFTKEGKHILWQLKPKNSGDPTKESSIYYFTNSAPPGFALTTQLMSIYESNDLRKVHWIAAVNANGSTWYRANKYKIRSDNTTEYSIVFRLEEVLLLLSESLAQQNKLTEAKVYLNRVRTRAGIGNIAINLSKDEFLDEILMEYRREFFTEMGQRFFTLKRFGRLNDLKVIKPDWKPFHKVWPLPQQELLLNPKMEPQNEGY